MIIYGLDTCSCVLEEEWDYSGPQPVRTILRMRTPCSLHAQAADPLDASYGEMQLRNKHRVAILQELPELSYEGWKESRPQAEKEMLNNLEQLGAIKAALLKPGLDFGDIEDWESNGNGTRKLLIDTAKLGLNVSQQAKLKSRTEKDFGKDKVRFK